MRVQLNPERITQTLFQVLFVILALGLIAAVIHKQTGSRVTDFAFDAFNIDGERSLMIWFKVVCALISTVTVLLIAAHGEASRGWRGLALVFGVLSIEEIIKTHEKINAAIKHLVTTSGWLNYPWVVLGFFGFLALLWAFRGFYRQLPVRTRTGLLEGVLIYAIGAVALDAMAGKIVSTYPHTIVASLAAYISEVVQMTGQILVVNTFLVHLAGLGSITLVPGDSPRAVSKSARDSLVSGR